jgi:hypothetical protein
LAAYFLNTAVGIGVAHVNDYTLSVRAGKRNRTGSGGWLGDPIDSTPNIHGTVNRWG